MGGDTNKQRMAYLATDAQTGVACAIALADSKDYRGLAEDLGLWARRGDRIELLPLDRAQQLFNGERGADRLGDWLQTYSGVQFYPLDPRPEDICIVDIAHGLSMKCRYNGHCTDFYSVAQHSVHVSEECERRWPERPDLALWGLLHDAGEAYLPDVPRPLKQMGVGILTECERKIMDVVAAKFGLSMPEPPELKIVDNALLATEMMYLMGDPPAPWFLPEPPLLMRIHGNLPSVAEGLFTIRYKELTYRGSV